MRIIKKFKITLLIFFIFSNAKAGNIYEEKIDSIFSTIGGNVSCIVMSTEHGDVIYSLNPGMEMIPASVTKLVTSIVAMDVLGPDYKFKTVVYSDANVTGGVVNGNLYLKGFGDPDLYSGDISTLAKEVAKTVRQVNGNIIYDNSFLDDNYYALADYYSGDTKNSIGLMLQGLILTRITWVAIRDFMRRIF